MPPQKSDHPAESCKNAGIHGRRTSRRRTTQTVRVNPLNPSIPTPSFQGIISVYPLKPVKSTQVHPHPRPTVRRRSWRGKCSMLKESTGVRHPDRRLIHSWTEPQAAVCCRGDRAAGERGGSNGRETKSSKTNPEKSTETKRNARRWEQSHELCSAEEQI